MIQTSAFSSNASRSKIHLNFQGYWRDCRRSGVPRRPGVFCVYRCRVDEENGTLTAIQLLYIGQAINAREAIVRHSRRKEWADHLQAGEELGFSFAPAILDRHAAVMALVDRHDPICNRGEPPALEPEDPRFPRQPISVLLSGRIQLLNYSFTAFDFREVSLRTVLPQQPRLAMDLLNWVEA